LTTAASYPALFGNLGKISCKNKMAVESETVVETPALDIANVEEPVKTDKEVIADEEKEEKKDEEKEDEELKEDITEEKKAVKEKKKAVVHKKDFEKDVVYLFQFNRCSTIPSLSPACLQVESWLKLHGIKFENVDLKNKLWSKEGKMLPFIEINGEKIAETNKIFETLSNKFEKDIDSYLDEDQKKEKEELTELVEKHLYWSVVHWRSVNHENLVKGYKMALPTALGAPLPPPAAKVYFNYSYCKKGLKMVKTSQVGTNTPQEIEQFGKDVLKKLSEKLGEKKFLFGDEVSSLDLVVFSHVTQVAVVDKEYKCALREVLQEECTNLLEFIERMKENVWGGDWEKATGEKLHMNPHLDVEETKEVGIKRNRGGTLSRIRGALEKKKHSNEKKTEDEEKEEEAAGEESEDLTKKESTLIRMMSVFKKKNKKTEEASKVEGSEDKTGETCEEKKEDKDASEKKADVNETSEETANEAKNVVADIVNEIADVKAKDAQNKETCEESLENQKINKEETLTEAKEIVTGIVEEVANAKESSKESEEL